MAKKDIDKLLKLARLRNVKHKDDNFRQYYSKMTDSQLKELVYENPTDVRIKEIFASVGGLQLLNEGGVI